MIRNTSPIRHAKISCMTYVPALLALMGVHLLAVASPGPAFVATIQISVRQSRTHALLHSLGLGLAVLAWAMGALFGLQALMQNVAGLFGALQLAGGLYLVYIGIQSWLHAPDPLGHSPEGPATRALTPWQAFARGFATNISNPKVMVFFASIFSLVLDPAWPAWVRALVLLIVFLDETVWNGALAILLSTKRAQTAYLKAKTTVDRIAGACMFAFGGRLIWGATRQALSQPALLNH